MKKFFLMFAIAGALVACDNSASTTENGDTTATNGDTTMTAPMPTDNTATGDTSVPMTGDTTNTTAPMTGDTTMPR